MSGTSVHASVQAGHSHGQHAETSVAPICTVFGIFFLLPCGFSALFVYHSILLAVIFAGVGVPLLLFGISRWVSEGMAGVGALGPSLAASGIPIFIISEIFIFLGLFASYWYVRLSAPAWPPAHTPYMPAALPLLMTALLIASSVTLHVGEQKLEHGDRSGFVGWLVLSLILGALFLGCTGYEYTHLFGEGFTPGTNIFSTIFFSITGFHASHVLVGLLAFVTLLLPALGGRTNVTFTKCVSIYWHFVDVVWIFVVSQIYFW